MESTYKKLSNKEVEISTPVKIVLNIDDIKGQLEDLDIRYNEQRNNLVKQLEESGKVGVEPTED